MAGDTWSQPTSERRLGLAAPIRAGSAGHYADAATCPGLFGVLSRNKDLVHQRIERHCAEHPDCRTHVLHTRMRACGLVVTSPDCFPPASIALAPGQTTAVAAVGDVWAHQCHSAGSSDKRQPASAEVLLALWPEHGPALIEQTSGMFAACIWDSAADRLHLILDWAGGIHSLYYAHVGEAFVFANSPIPLLPDAWDGELDVVALAQYLDYGHILPPHTLFRGVKKLAPGCVLTHGPGASVETTRVFKHRFDPDPGTDWVAHFRETHRRCVARVLSRHGEGVGAFVSGGIDSSYNAAVMSELTKGDMPTFSIGYADASVDESHYSRLVARHLGTDHHEMCLSSAEALDDLPSMVYALREPAMDNSFVPTYHLARFARQHVGTVVGGDGPDHLMGRHYPVATARLALRRMPGAGRLAESVLRQVASGWRSRLWRRARRGELGRFAWKALASGHGDPVQAYLSIYREIAYRDLIPARFRALLSDAARSWIPAVAPVDPLVTEVVCEGSSEFDRLVALDVTIDGSFGVFAKVGTMAAHHGLNVREPFLDVEMCRLLHLVPESLKVHGTRTRRLTNRASKKHVLYEAAQGIVPDEVLRKPKVGFRAPIDTWLRQRTGQLQAVELLPALLCESDLFSPDAVDNVLCEHRSGVRDHGTLILMLVTLDLWYAIFIQQRASMPNWTWTDWLRQ